MTLAVMLSEDEDAFICDMAETYHILDYRALPVTLLATLASGLRENSRIKMKMAGANYIPPEVVIPQAVDYLMMIMKILNGDKKKSKYMTDLVFGSKKKDPTVKFKSGEDFNKAWARMTRGINEHG